MKGITMKKITSVFITALVFLVGFTNAVFAESSSDNVKVNQLISRKKKTGSKKLKKASQPNKNTPLEASKGESLDKENIKVQDLGKIENLERSATQENIKLENLDADNLKVQDLGKIEDLENKR
jgi:short-subunit dehydrogenase